MIFRKQKHGWVFIVLMIFLVSFVGCSSKPSVESKVAITFYYGAGLEENKSYQKIFSSFEEKYPEIKLKIQFACGQGYYPKLLTQIVGNVAPDIIFIQDSKLAFFVRKGVLEDITPYIQKDTLYDVSDFYQKAIGSFTFDNKIYGVPKDMGPLVLFYNKDIFDKERVPYPDENWTWEDIVRHGGKLTKFDENNRLLQVGLIGAKGAWLCFVLQNGGKIFNEEGTKCLLDSQESIEAIKFVRDLSLRYKVAPTASQERELSGRSANFFYSQRAAMSIAGRWMTPSYRKANINFDVTSLPKGKKKATLLHISGFAILSSSKHKEEAWKFLSFLTGKEGERIMTETGLLVPPRKSIAESDLFLSSTPPFNNQVFLEAREYGETILLNPAFSFYPQEWKTIGDMIGLVVSGEEEAEKIIPETISRMNAKIGEGNKQ